MTRRELIAETFRIFGTDKCEHGYATIYAHVPTTIRSVLEIGVGGGQSLRAWRSLFPRATVCGIDVADQRPDTDLNFGHVRQIKCPIKEFVLSKWFPNGTEFDLVVDDGSHILEDVLHGFRELNGVCRGLYVIEDVKLENVQPILLGIGNSKVNSVIQTHSDGDSRVVVAQFNRVIQW